MENTLLKALYEGRYRRGLDCAEGVSVRSFGYGTYRAPVEEVGLNAIQGPSPGHCRISEDMSNTTHCFEWSSEGIRFISYENL